MNKSKARALTQFPSVLLTLISIIQALALELLWSKIQESDFLWSLHSEAMLGWLMVFTSFLGVLLIWLIFTTMVMGLIWQPLLRDSIAPFIIGLQEFLLISLVAEDFNPYWLIVLASIFVTTNWIIHISMRRARSNPENEMFFHGVNPATWKDFLPLVALVAGFGGAGVWLLLGGPAALSFIAVIAANCIMIGQLFGTRRLWQRAMKLGEEIDGESNENGELEEVIEDEANKEP